MKKTLLTRSLSLLMALLMVLALPAGTLLEVRAADLGTESTQPVEDTEQPEAEETKTEESKVEATKTEEPKVEETKTEEPKVKETKTEEPKVKETKTEEPKVKETKTEEPKVEETKTQEPKAEEKTVYVKNGKYLAPEELNVYITARMDQRSDNAAPEAEDLEEKYTGVVVFYDYNETDEEKRLEHPYFFYYKEGELQDENPVFVSAKGYVELLNAPVAEKTVNGEVSEDQAERLVYVAREVYLEQDAQEHEDYLFAFNRENEDNGLFTGVYEEKTYADGLMKEETVKQALAPAAEVQLTATVTVDGVALEWGAVDGATGYRLFRTAEGAEQPEVVEDFDAETLEYTDDDVASGESYTYSVRAYLGDASKMTEDQDYTKTEKWSAEVKADAVYYLAAPKVTWKSSNNQVVLTWNAVDGADGYILKRSENGADWVDYPVTDQLTYTDKQVKTGIRYFYAVQAVHTEPEAQSAFYDQRADHEDYVIFYNIPNVTFESRQKGVLVKWTTDSAATGYRVFRKADGEKSWTVVKDITDGQTDSYLDTKAVNGKKNYYAVRAYYGDEEQMSQDGYNPKIWSGYKANAYYFLCVTSIYSNNGALTMKWSAVSGASGYQVNYRANLNEKWGRPINAGNRTSYSLKPVKNGQKYYVAVRAYTKNKAGKITYTPWTKIAEPVVYHAPAKVSLGLQQNGIKIAWNLDSKATGYRIYRRTGSKTVAIQNVPASRFASGTKTGTYLDPAANLTSGGTYYYTIRAYYGASNISKVLASNTGDWAYYIYVKTKFLTAPVLSSVTNDLGGSKLTWKPVPSANGYFIYRKEGTNGKWKLIGKVSNGRTSVFVDRSIFKEQSGTVQIYTVRAYVDNAKTLSGYDYGGITLYYMSKPSKVKVGKTTSNGTSVTWTAVRGATCYCIYRRVGTTGGWETLGLVYGTRYVDTQITKQSTRQYYYTLRSIGTYKGRNVSSTYEKMGYTYGIIWSGSERNEWVKKGGNTFYVDAEGRCVTGWHYLYRNGRQYKYYFDNTTGALVTNLYSYFGRSYRDMKTMLEVYLDSNDNYAGHVTFLIYDDATRSYCIPAVCFRCIGNLTYTKAWNGIGTSYMRAGAGKDEFVQLVEGGAYERYAIRVSGSDSFFHSVLYNQPNSYSLQARTYNSLIDNRNNSVACIRCQAIYAYLIHDLMKNGYGYDNDVKVNIYRNERDSGPFGIPQVKYISRSQNYDPSDPAVTGKFFYETRIREGNGWISATAGAAPWEWY